MKAMSSASRLAVQHASRLPRLQHRARAADVDDQAAGWILVGGLPLVLALGWYRSSAYGEPATAAPPSARVASIAPAEAGFFSKRLAGRQGIQVKAHADVSDEALLVASQRVDRMMKRLRPAVTSRLRGVGAEVRVLGERQRTTDMPDLAHWRGKVWDKASGKTLDERARGLGGVPRARSHCRVAAPLIRFIPYLCLE